MLRSTETKHTEESSISNVKWIKYHLKPAAATVPLQGREADSDKWGEVRK